MTLDAAWRLLLVAAKDASRLADLDRVPEPVFQPAPQFPFAMRREAHTGTVVVDFIVDVNGVVLDPVARESSHHGFDEAAVEAARKLDFEPAKRADGTPFAARILYRYAFTLTECAQ